MRRIDKPYLINLLKYPVAFVGRYDARWHIQWNAGEQIWYWVRVRVLSSTGVIIVLSVFLRYTVLPGLKKYKWVAAIEAESAAERVTIFLASCYRKTETNYGCVGQLSRVTFNYYKLLCEKEPSFYHADLILLFVFSQVWSARTATQTVLTLLLQVSVQLIQAGWKKTARRAADPIDATNSLSGQWVSWAGRNVCFICWNSSLLEC